MIWTFDTGLRQRLNKKKQLTKFTLLNELTLTLHRYVEKGITSLEELSGSQLSG